MMINGFDDVVVDLIIGCIRKENIDIYMYIDIF